MFKKIVVICIALLLPMVVLANLDEDNWITPNKWSTLEDKDFEKQPSFFEKCSVAPSDDAVAHIYFKKFIGNLFSRKKMQYDETGETLQRTVIFTLHPAQLDRLEHLSDPRDLDAVLTEIFKNARTIAQVNGAGIGDYKIVSDETNVFRLVIDIIKDVWQILSTSEVQFLLWVTAAVLMGWYISRRYQIGIVKMIFCSFLLFGYLYTYIECNRKLDVDRMLEVLDNEQQQNSAMESGWSIWRIFGSKSPTQKPHDKIKKATRINLPICRPDHVVIIYINEMFLKQLELLLDKCTGTFLSLRENLPFPFNYVAGFALVFLIGYIMKLVFKYILSPKAWAQLLNQSSSGHPTHHQHPPHAHVLHATIEDRVSGENLRILLNAFTASKQQLEQSSSTPSIANSGVQELNAITEKNNISDTSSTSTASTNDNNNSECKENNGKEIASEDCANPEVTEVDSKEVNETKT